MRGKMLSCLLLTVLAATAVAEPVELSRSESEARPTPGWVQMIELGAKDPALKGYRAPAGVRVEVVAREPLVVNPVSMRFQDDGSLLVIEWKVGKSVEMTDTTLTFKDGSTRPYHDWRKDVKDELKRLTDTDGDGQFDKVEVLMNDLQLPSSVLVHDGWYYFTTRGGITRRKQSKPGGPFDVNERIVQGLAGFNQHQASGLTMRDGWLYVTSGDDDSHAEGSDGKRIDLLRTGAVWRCRPDGSKLEIFARGFRNPYGNVAFDADGNMFHMDNDQEDGSKFQGCRLVHVMEEADYGWRLRPGVRCCWPDADRGAVFGELPGRMAPMLKTGRGAPCGVMIYNGPEFPQPFQGLVVYPDVFQKNVRAYKTERDGSTFKVTEQFTLLESTTDGSFRPCQAVQGPDGSIYLSDWRTNSAGPAAAWGDGKSGRIWRLSWAGDKEKIAERKPAAATAEIDEALPADKITPAVMQMLASKMNAGEPAPRRAAGLALGRLASRLPANDRLQKQAAADLLAALRKTAATDAYLRDGLLRAMERVGAPSAALLVELANTGVEADRVFAIDTLAACRTREGAGAIVRVLAEAKELSDAQTVSLLKSYRYFQVEPPIDPVPIVQWLESHPAASPAQQAAALESVALVGQMDVGKLLPTVLRLLAHKNEQTRLAAIKVIAQQRLISAAKPLVEALKDVERPAEEKRAILAALINLRGQQRFAQIGFDPGVDGLVDDLAAYAASQASGALRAETLGLVAQLNFKKAEPIAAKLLEGNAQESTVAISVLGADAAWAKKIGQRFIDGKLSNELLSQVASALQRHMTKEGSPEFASLRQEVLKRGMSIATDPEGVKRLETLVATKGDANRGKAIFLDQARTACVTCHKLEGVGAPIAIGPDLTGLHQNATVAKLAEAILEPSKEIKEGFELFNVRTKDGQAYSGFKVSTDNDQVVLRDAAGQQVVVPNANIKRQDKSGLSLMPEGLTAGLTMDEFVDLLAFLKDAKVQAAMRPAEKAKP